MVLFDREPRHDLDLIRRDFESRFQDSPSLTEPSESGTVLSFGLGECNAFIAPIEAAFPWSDLEGPCETSVLWPKAIEQLRSHKGHSIVTVTGDASPGKLASHLTQLATSVMATTPGAIGLFWSNSAMVIPKDMFTEFAERVLPEGPPINIWVDFRVGWKDDKTSSGFTTGLNSLGHKEFEVLSSPEKPSELRERLENLAYYVLENGPILKDGDTLGVDENEKIAVSFQDSAFHQQGTVIQLNFPTKKKRLFGLFG